MKNLLSILFVGILSFAVSCTKENVETESDKYEIDLNVANQTDWKMAVEILDLVNLHRASIGKGTIQIDYNFASAYATNHTNYMISKKLISHDNFLQRSQALKSRGATSVAENVAYGYNNAEDVVNAWLLSPSHKAIIEGPYTNCGFGVVKAENGQFFYTQLFYKN